jgi:glycosyltransferase involved in cell wall biosynthesis
MKCDARNSPRYSPPTMAGMHVLINGLSMGSGGGFTVGRELLRHLAIDQPDSIFTLAIIEGHPLHEEIGRDHLPDNCRIHRAPAETRNRLKRMRYERGGFVAWARANGVDRVVQLNGMIIPNMRVPTLSHAQDPWPYRPQAYVSWKEHVAAFLKRRAQRQAMRLAECMGFTSNYLRDLIVGRSGITPRRAEVFYNGLPEPLLARARQPLPDWESRGMELLSVSNVHPYKRQYLVVQALPKLVNRPGLRDLVYHVVGHAPEPFSGQLMQLARSLGVERHLVVHGRLTDEETQSRFAGARAFVLMSVCESFGIPAIEAMTFGTPVVTSDCCAMPEVCGDSAILSPVDDVDSLADNLHRALTDRALVEQLRRRGAQRVQRFRWDQTAAGMAKALRELPAK